MSNSINSAAVERKTLHLRCNNYQLNLTQVIILIKYYISLITGKRSCFRKLKCSILIINSTLQGLSRLLRDDQFVDVTLVINNPSKLYSSDTDSGESSNEGKVYRL